MKHTMKIERKNIFYAFLGQTNEKNKEIKTIRCVCWLCEYKCVCAPLYILFVANWRCCDAYNVNMCELNYQSPFLVSTQKCHLKINLIILWDFWCLSELFPLNGDLQWFDLKCEQMVMCVIASCRFNTLRHNLVFYVACRML